MTMDSPITGKAQLLHRSIAYEAARQEESNILLQLSYPDKRLDFFFQLYEREKSIREIVTGHLKLNNDQACRLGQFSEWVHGSFNVCIPVYVDNWHRRRIMIRFPLPYKVGEASNPGNIDEKVRSEAATYIWLQENCPDIPVPYLWGFGTGNDQHFTIRNKGCIRLGPPNESMEVGYLLMEFIEPEQGRMLSESWGDDSNDLVKRQRLFRDLSKIMLSLKRLPFTKIGSLTVDDEGNVSLANRPLSVIIPEAENGSCPAIMDRDSVYGTIEPYVMDLFAHHDSRFQYQPNSVNDMENGLDQIEALTLMRGTLPNFLDRATREGPFYLTLTDLHQSNIFVDDNWHITAIIDLEWACTRPIEMLRPPLWLTNQPIDDLVDEKLTEFHQAVEVFISVLDEEESKENSEEKKQQGSSLLPQEAALASILRKNWSTGRLWYFRALDSLTGLMAVFHNHIEPIFDSDIAIKSARFWRPDAEKVIQKKVMDKREYDVKLRQAFKKAVQEDP